MAFMEGFRIVHGDAFANGKKGGILKEQRVIRGLTQQQVADRAKITLQQYQKFESGERNLKTASFQIACRVLEALEMDIVKYHHNGYIIGEKIFVDHEGMKYEKTGKLVTEDVE